MTDPPHPPLSQADARYGAARSRRLLIDTIDALGPFAGSVTVIGAHAVHVWVQEAWGPVDIEATRDGDVVLNPVFVAESPKLVDLMSTIGVTPATADRPGIYGYTSEADLPWGERTTVDLIVPEAYAGPGRRAARITGQPGAVSRARGLELAIWDRHLTTLTTVDEPAKSIPAHVAGPAALLIAKAHKVHERLQQVTARPDRLRPKDSGDIALLTMIAPAAEAANTMAAGIREHPEIFDAVTAGAAFLVEMYRDPESLPRLQATDALAARFDATTVNDAIETWLADFQHQARAAGLQP